MQQRGWVAIRGFGLASSAPDVGTFAAPQFDAAWFQNKPLTWNTMLESGLKQK